MCHGVGYGTAGFSMFCLMISRKARYSKTLLYIKCMFSHSPQHSSEYIHIVGRIHRDIVTNLRRCTCTVLLILLRFEIHLKIFRHISKNRIPDLLKIYWKPSCCKKTDGQIEMKKPKAASPSFANTPKIITRSGKLKSCITLYPASMIL